MAELSLNTDSMELKVVDLKLIETERQVTKQVRQNSDDLRRAKELYKAYSVFAQRGVVVFAEIPTGAQSARAAYAFGVALGLLASCPKPIIQLQPSEVKLATVGTKTASKSEVIEWCVEKYPDAPWIKHKRAGKMVIGNKNEHLADAIAVAHTGVGTDSFQQLLAIWKANTIAA